VRETLAKRGQTCPLPPRTKYTPRIAVCGNAGGPELATTVFPFILRGVDLLGIDSDWCDLETRRVLWERMARGGDLNPIHLEEISRSVNFDELPDVFGAFLERGPGGRTTVRVGG
jgi:acrylyl-CoA reductase (NADPH)